MAVIGCGNYSVNSNIDNNKTYIYVKLTESAHKALEEYLKYKNCNNSQPNINFNGSEGEIKIPSQSHGEAKFKFQMQKAQESDGPQGSFEAIRQSKSSCLDSLGSLMSVLRIQAKDDSYEKTRQSMAQVMAQNGKICVKELKQNGVMSRRRHVRTPPVGLSASSKSEQPNGLSSSPLRNHGAKPPPAWSSSVSKQPVLSRKLSEALKKVPIRERIIQLLAVKPMDKFQLIRRLNSEGVKESDKRHISSVLQSVATVKDNSYHLLKHLWSEVNEGWSFYTQNEKESLQRNRAQYFAAQEKDDGPPVRHNLSPSLSVNLPDPLKRPLENGFNSMPKRSRVLAGSENQISNPRFGGSDRSQSSECGGKNYHNSWHPEAREESQEGMMAPDSGLHHSPSSYSLSPLSQNNSPKHPSYFYRNRPEISRNSTISNLTSLTNDTHEDQQLTPSSSPDSQQENKDATWNYKERYYAIKNKDQRRQYKIDFNRIYKEYKVLHSDLEKIKLYFEELEAELEEHPVGTIKYAKIKQKMFDQYDLCQSSFHEKKQRYNHMDEVLKHIKQLVSDYDASLL